MRGRRRPRGAPPAKPFDQAFEGIDTLERTVAARSIETHFTLEQVARWMLPDETVDKLQAAFPYTRDGDRTAHWYEEMTLPIEFPAVRCHLTIHAKSIGMLVPASGQARDNQARSPDIMLSLRAAYGVHLQFEKVRQVARWLNLYATVGAARHYCPWLTGILPTGHAFHEASGQIFREPSKSMAEIMPTMRECGAIMASALLAGDDPGSPKTGFGVRFHGHRDDMEYQSHVFWLL